jgi:hypothetical protein
MLSRRDLLTAGVAGGLTNAGTGSLLPAQPGQTEALNEIADAVEAIDRSIDEALLSNNTAFGNVARLRTQYETYFRTTQRFPEFIDIGLSVFMEVYDWHIKNRQQLTVTRGPDSRYWIRYMFTTLVLRGEQEANYIGVAYEK